jgi:hypothetical protein
MFQRASSGFHHNLEAATDYKDMGREKKTICTSTLTHTHNKETAIFDTSPFLCKWITTAYFSNSGKTPIIIDLLKIEAKGLLI